MKRIWWVPLLLICTFTVSCGQSSPVSIPTDETAATCITPTEPLTAEGVITPQGKIVPHRFACPAYDGSGGCVCDGGGILPEEWSNYFWQWLYPGGDGAVAPPGDGDGISG